VKFSSVPLLFGLIVVFWIWAARACVVQGVLSALQFRALNVWLALLTAWGITTTVLSTTGAYRSEAFYTLLPGLWVPLAPVALSLALLGLWPDFRAALWTVTTATSPRAFLWLHALRVAAIGGVIKGAQGQLPQSFAFPIGIPDLAFGLVSLVMAMAYHRLRPGRATLIGWNLAGMGVLMSAPILMQLGLPGPFHTFTTQPDATALFDFPMVLAPTLVVTLLFFTNGWHAFTLWRTAKGLDATHRAVGQAGVAS
jgi:hypothetical protein